MRHEQAVLRSGRSVTAGVVDGFNETATVNGGSTTAMDRQNGQSRNFPNSARAQSGHLLESDGAPAGSPGYYCRLNDVTGAWSTQTEYWIEHPVSKVRIKSAQLVLWCMLSLKLTKASDAVRCGLMARNWFSVEAHETNAWRGVRFWLLLLVFNVVEDCL